MLIYSKVYNKIYPSEKKTSLVCFMSNFVSMFNKGEILCYEYKHAWSS